MTHTCIKPGCGASYEDSDPDPFYCPSCTEQKKSIATEIDTRLGSRPKKVVVPRFTAKDFIGNKGQRFFKASELL